jgi:4-hydroxy-tetrahydrodipicolinate reductase
MARSAKKSDKPEIIANAPVEKRTRVALVGLGPIGVEVGKAICARGDLEIVAAVDRAPGYAGRRLAGFVPKAPDVPVEAALGPALASHTVDVVVLCTGSRWKSVMPDIDTAIAAGCHLVSTCEELSAPCSDPVGWSRLDARAKESSVSVLGTGVNPGFVMDRLVLQLAGACVRVDEISVERVVDAAHRREPLRKKVGEGLTVAQFKAGVKEGTLGHVGLRESAQLIARGLGWKIEKYNERIEPVEDHKGICKGLKQTAVAVVAKKERIKLLLQMSVGAPFPHDRIRITGDPPLDVNVAGGTHGDRGTVGTVVNAIRRLRTAPRGLITVADVYC